MGNEAETTDLENEVSWEELFAGLDECKAKWAELGITVNEAEGVKRDEWF
ncbi:MAG TPA: hypothetical protein VMZ30_02060 [Pyrinomonadaceae bacterium]|nr:hypothetical protein [Pyrinomonadaceae bacterium]